MKKLSCVRCWGRLSLASRVLLVAMLAILLGGPALLYVTVRNSADSHNAELAEQLDDALGSLVIVLGEQAVVGDYATIQQILDLRVKRRNTALITWTDSSGKTLVARDQAVAMRAADWFVKWVDSPHFDGERKLEVGGQSYGRISVRLTTAPAMNLIWDMFVRQLQIILFGGTLFLVLAAILLRCGLRPLQQLKQGAECFGQGDHSVRLALGGTPDVLPAIHAFNDMAGKIEGLLGSQQERENILKESEGRLHDITSSLGVGVCMLDRDCRLNFMNPEAERLLGWSEAELFGKYMHLLLHRRPGEVETTLDDCPIRRTNLAGKTYRSADEIFVRRDGSTFFVSLVSAPILKNGVVTGSVMAFFDITERRQAEEKLRKFSRALEQSANSVVIADLEGTIEYVNPRFCDATGYTMEEVIGQNPRILKSGETSHEEYQQIWNTITAGDVWRGEFHNRRKDGSLFWESASIAPIRNEKGQITHFVAVKEDITRRKEAEEQMKRLNETLEQRVHEEVACNREKDHMLIRQSRLAAMGEMIGNIAHQWRQPLNALGLLLANIKDAYAYNELDEVYLNESVARGRLYIDKMSTTIDDFRNFFKPNREKMPFSLAGTIRDALSVVEASFNSSNIVVTLNAEQDATTLGFPNEYAQVVLNILGNARDAIRDRGVQNGRIQIAVSRNETTAYVAIRDNGGGIPDEILEKIFDPYFTTRESGTGIGLYMSKMIIENNMNGRIEARNVVEGAEFRIITPLCLEAGG
ncbi:MAG TPA: PAS domain S-box protein [Sulfuricella sp.]|nr:PAS domain S-box protein [Sulfuricella sp.]